MYKDFGHDFGHYNGNDNGRRNIGQYYAKNTFYVKIKFSLYIIVKLV